MIAVNWSKTKEVRERGILVWSIEPGFNATGLSGSAEDARSRGAMPPEVGGGVIASVVRREREADAGKMVGRDGKSMDW